jgi:hypothetical protein
MRRTTLAHFDTAPSNFSFEDENVAGSVRFVLERPGWW